MNANRRAEILQAVELHDRDLLAEISELEAENKRLEVVNKESQRQLVLLDSDNEQLESERDMLKAAIATPELYVGVVSEVLAEERESVVAENSKLRARIEDQKEFIKLSAQSYDANKIGWEKDIEDLRTEREQLKAEANDLRYSLEHIDGDERYAKLRAGLERLVKAANEAKEELEYDITNGRVAIDILKDAIAAAKDGCAPVQNQMMSERSLLKNAILFINNEWEKGTYSPEWFMEQVIVKIAVEKAKEVVPMDNR